MENQTIVAEVTSNKREELRQNSLDVISQLNAIPGFCPEALSEVYTDETTGEQRTMLPLSYKKAWFRAKYPNGCILSR